jgi:hypothetical protein
MGGMLRLRLQRLPPRLDRTWIEGTNVAQAAVIVQTSGGSWIGSATADQ